MRAIRIGNNIFMADKVVSVSLGERTVKVVTTICTTTLTYNTANDARKAFDDFYAQLMKQEVK